MDGMQQTGTPAVAFEHVSKRFGDAVAVDDANLDIDEALDLGDKVLVMEAGRAVQFAEPCDILRNPATEFVDRLVTRKRTVYAR